MTEQATQPGNGPSGLWVLAIFGILLGGLGVFLTRLGADGGADGLVYMGWIVATAGGFATTLGTIALGVYMGLAARD